MEIKCLQFNELSRESLRDEHLQKALKRIYERLGIARNRAFSSLENPEALRDQAYRIKKKTLDRLDQYLEKLEEQVTRLGGKVHWASDAARAREIIEALAEERHVKTIVKGKSMFSEEIGLNESLINRGIEVYETDLGEYIVQLAGEPPSHIVGPAIHKTKEQISRLFSENLGVERLEDPRDMTMLARKVLRREFLKADMGITGVNFAVAETGTIVLFENEGNIRMSTTLPHVHVAIMGIEKVVPTLEDLGILMKLLVRSATGQKMSTYVSMINGPKGEGDIDGAREFHLVIIDNGRSRILSDPEERDTLHCIRCGACQNICPVYLKIGGHAYGWIYSGPIGAILTPQIINRKEASKLPYASTLCGACADICPVRIDHPSILLALRRKYAEDPEWQDTASLLEKGVIRLSSGVLKRKTLYKWGSRAARIAQRFMTGLVSKTGFLLPKKIADRIARVQPFGRKNFRQLWKAMSKEKI
ncbi:LutB/LldF family L-lactate oxidation iron-sulfur protein [Thermodesulfobacteriota bacterium]